MVVEPFGDQTQHVELAVGQLGEGAIGGRATSVGQRADGGGQLVVEHDVTAGRHTQRVFDAFRSGALDEVAAGAVAQRRQRGVVVLRHRQHDHLDVGVVGRPPSG